jgi:molecular chaperone GrpE
VSVNKSPVDKTAEDDGSGQVDLAAEREQWAAEKAELQDRLLRSNAEFQNFRRRTEQQRVETYDFATADAIRAILPMLDDFERALKTEAADKEYSAGIQLIYNRLAEALKKLGLEPTDSKGQPFDPQIHHAVDMVETDEMPDHMVLDDYQRGYNFKGRLLRPAMVKVAVQPAPK